MAYRKGLNLKSVSFIVIVVLTALSIYYVSLRTRIVDTVIATEKDDQPPSGAKSTGKLISFISTRKDGRPPSEAKPTGKYLYPFIPIDNSIQSQIHGNSTKQHLPFTPTGNGDQTSSQNNSTGKHFPLSPAGKGDQILHQDRESARQNNPDKIDYRQRFLDFAKEDLLHTKPPIYIPQLKNPCWYENSTEKLNLPTLRCLPYFMILGQNKCGTTNLYLKLVTHPDVVPAIGKEPQFWARIRHCYCCGNLTYRFDCAHNRPWNFEEYIKYFDPTAKKIQNLLMSRKQKNVMHSAELITGEATPSNMWDNRWWWNYKVNQNDTEPPAVTNADYIHHFMPSLKIIIILRNPISRLFSDYLYVSQGKKSPEGFHGEVIKEINSFQNCSRYHDIRYCMFRNSFDERNKTSTARLCNGLYALFIEEYMKLFPQKQFHIIRLEDYSKNNTEVMAGIFHFLNLRDTEKTQKHTKINSKKAVRKKVGDMLPETKALLTDFYQPYSQRLADLLNDKRYLWRD